MFAQVRLQRIGIWRVPGILHDEGDHRLVAVSLFLAHYGSALDTGEAVQRMLDLARVDVEARADDHLLEAPHHKQCAIRMQLAQVARGVPAAVTQCGRRGLGITEIAGHQARAANPYFAPLTAWLGGAGVRIHNLQLGPFDAIARAGIAAGFLHACQVQRARVFAHGIAMVQRLAEQGFHLLLEGQIKRPRAGVQIAQLGGCGTGDSLLLAILQQACKQGGRALQLGDTVVGQRIHQVGGLELATHLQRRTRMQRRQQHGAQAKDMRHRHKGVDLVLWPQLARLGRHAREVRHATVAHHHALGRAGGAGCEDDGRHRVAHGLGLWPGIGKHGAVRQTRHAGRRGAKALAMRSRGFGDAVGEVDDAGIGLVGKGAHLTRGHARIHAAGPGTHAAGSQQQGGMLGAVFCHDQHAVAGAHLLAAQLGLQRVHQPAEISVAQDAIGQMDERAVGRLLQPAVQQFVNTVNHQLFSFLSASARGRTARN
ncbi:hypothetical protein D3C72_1159740 [compost metagenome]